VRIAAIGINPGRKPTFRAREVMGHGNFHLRRAPIAGGVVEELGEGVKNINRGDRCYNPREPSPGTYAQKALLQRVACAPAADTDLVSAGPRRWAFSICDGHIGAMVLRGRPMAGETILVHGRQREAWGMAVVQFAACGRAEQSSGTAGTETRAAKLVAEGKGAHHVFSIITDANYLKELMDSHRRGRGG